MLIKKTPILVMLVVLGVLTIAISFFFQDVSIGSNISVQPLLIVIGCLAFCWSLPFIFLKIYFKKNPQAMKQSENKMKDERSALIKAKARANAGEITQWLIIVLAFITLLTDLPAWLTFTVLGVFMLYKIITVIFIYKYKNEM